MGGPSLARAVAQFRTPHPGWLSAAVLVEMASMRAYARMQRGLLRSAGLRVSLVRHIALAYAAHSLSVTLPGGPAFSTSFNYQQMRRFGATPAVAASCIALSGIMSSTALAILGVLGGIAAHGRPNWPFMVAEIAAFAAVGYAGYRLIRHPGVLDRAGGLADTVIARVRRRTAEPGPGPVTAFLTQLRSVRMRPRQLTAAGGYAFANWLLDALCLWMSCVAVGASHLTATGVLIAYCAGMAAGSALPVIPGGLGVIDGALILGLIAGGLDAGLAIAGVLLYRAISLGFIIGTGWVFWLIIRRRSHAEPARSRADEPAGNG
nr:YbhN family protein [Planosporangium mesophilum]